MNNAIQNTARNPMSLRQKIGYGIIAAGIGLTSLIGTYNVGKYLWSRVYGPPYELIVIDDKYCDGMQKRTILLERDNRVLLDSISPGHIDDILRNQSSLDVKVTIKENKCE